MNTLKNTLLIGSGAVGNFPKPIYCIEDAVIISAHIIVEFYVGDEQHFATIDLVTAKQFVKSTGMNEYCFDYIANGEHQQDCGSMNVDTYLSENLNVVLVALFEAQGYEAYAEGMAA